MAWQGRRTRTVLEQRNIRTATDWTGLLFMTDSGSGHIFIHDNIGMGRQERERHSLWIIGLLFAAPGVDASIPLFYSFSSLWTFSFFFLGLASPDKPDLMA